MKRYLFSLLSLLLLIPLSLSSCQDEDFGYSQEEIFRNAYERNFIKAFGEIDPEETWDFSKYSKRPNRGATTRAMESDGWYRVDQRLIDGLLKSDLSQGEAFCMLSGQESFKLIPIYQNGADEGRWTLKVTSLYVGSDGRSQESTITAWNKSEKIQIITSETGACAHCSGRGYVVAADEGQGTIACKSCNNGYVYLIDDLHKDLECTSCSHTGKVNGQLCLSCGGEGTNLCSDCKGLGYTTVTKQNGNSGKYQTTYYSCRPCGGNGSSNKKLNNIIKGNGSIDCSNPNCVDGYIQKDCDDCRGTGYFSKCTFCDGNQEVYVCGTCKGTGITTENSPWKYLTETENTSNATAIKGQPFDASSAFGTIPTGSIIYFTLEYTDANGIKTIKTSLGDNMRIFSPNAIDLDGEVRIIACDEDGDKDYNDLVFAIVGSPKVPVTISNPEDNPFTSVIDKRYMAEDFGSNSDWDFNDIVVDVKQTIKRKLSGTGASITIQEISGSKIVNATIKRLCGTLPLQLTIGNTLFTKIDDPTDFQQSIDQLSGAEAIGSTPEVDRRIGIDINYSTSVTGWDPDLNNISLKVWKKDDTQMTNDEIWQTGFPTQGGVPYIIATDITNSWTSETQDIRNMDWFRNKFMGGVSWP